MSGASQVGWHRRALGLWDRLLFAEVSSANYAALRVVYGVVLLGWALSLAPDLLDFYSADGILPEHPSRSLSWSLLQLSSSDALLVGLFVGLVVAAVALIVGVAPRLAAVVALVALISLGRRNPFVVNSGDLLLRNLAFLLALAPTGAALMLRGRGDRGTWRDLRFPTRPVWPLRLVQIQLAVGYAFSVYEKADGSTWINGTAVSYALRIGDLIRFPAPDLLTDPLVVVNLLTWGALAVELSLAVLVWFRRLRPWVLLAGVALHLGIDLFLEVGFFSYLMLTAYLAFVPPEALERVVRRVVGLVGSARPRAREQPAPAVGGTSGQRG